MKIKQPVCYDTSHWKIVPDFALVFPPPLLVFTKATEGLTMVDATFSRYFADLMQDGIARGAYHFFRKAVDAYKQAKHFCDTVRSQITDADILVLDAEEGGEKASQLWAWFDHARRQFPNNQFLLYSRKNILDPIVMTQAEKDYFKQIPVWTAGYPTFPDLFSKPPAGYIPDQSKFGPVWVWQYSSHGKIEGISGDVDCNWLDPIFAAMLQPVQPVPPTEPPSIYVTVTLSDGRVYSGDIPESW